MRKERNFDFFTFIISLIIISVFMGIIYFLYDYIFQISDSSELVENFVSRTDEVPVTNVVEKQVNTNETTYDTQSMYNKIYEELTANDTPEEILVKEDAYFYNQLDETGKKIYGVLVRNIDNLKTGTYTIDLGTTFNDLLHEANGKEILNTSYQAAWDAFLADNPNIFYIDITKIYLYTKTITTGSKTRYEISIGNNNESYFAQGFTSVEQVNEALYNIENIKNEILSTISTNNTYEKVKEIHDWLVDNVEYDTTLNRIHAHNIYGTLVERNVVCEGYAKTFKYLLDEINIPCVIVTGTGTDDEGKTENHAWNYVRINNAWYAVDVTWDDPIIVGNGKLTGKYKYKYFLKGYNQFVNNHRANGVMSSQGVEFMYPELCVDDYK